jgi:hypothetical protein
MSARLEGWRRTPSFVILRGSQELAPQDDASAIDLSRLALDIGAVRSEPQTRARTGRNRNAGRCE